MLAMRNYRESSVTPFQEFKYTQCIAVEIVLMT